MICVDNLSKKFGRLNALQDISMSLESGKAYALLGPNGSGKTTLIKCILGLVIPTGGTIRFDGKSIKNDWTYRRSIGYMPQIGQYPQNMKIGEVVMSQEITPLLAEARSRGCAYQVGTDMLFEQIPAYLDFFGLPTTTPEELRRLARFSKPDPRPPGEASA